MEAGWNSNRIAGAFVALMERLGYDRYGVQGGDIGVAERDHTLVRWTEVDRRGHFLAMENPQALAADLRAFFTERV